MRLFIILLSSLTLLGMGCESLGGAASMETRSDSMSYALGQIYAKDIKSGVIDQGVELDTDLLMEAFRSTQGEDPAEPILSDQEIQILLFSLQQELRSKATPQQQPQQPTSQRQANPNANVAIKTGQVAPDFTQPTPEGENLSLSDLRGKVVLVDFWASWCKPCRRENPNVVRVYDKYKDKGFEILGVSLDAKREAWLGAIEQDQLGWMHVSDLEFWNNAAAQTYGVRGIPYTVLVDTEGKIIAQNLRGPSLEAKLAEIFGES